MVKVNYDEFFSQEKIDNFKDELKALLIKHKVSIITYWDRDEGDFLFNVDNNPIPKAACELFVKEFKLDEYEMSTSVLYKVDNGRSHVINWTHPINIVVCKS